MAQIKTRGGQLDIQDIATEIANDPSAIDSIADGLSGTGSPTGGPLDTDYLRIDGNNIMSGELNLGVNSITNVVDLTMTGNLAVDGTVDGRDIDADGTTQDAHIADTLIHYSQATIDHTKILNKGTTSHADLDLHVGNGLIHAVIDDASDVVTDLWSALKITNELVLKSDTSHTHAIGTLSDVTITSLLTDQGLMFNGTIWVNAQVIQSAASAGSGESILATSIGKVLSFKDIKAAAGGEITVTAVADDVEIGINPTALGDAINLGDLGDVTFTGSPALIDEDLLIWNGTNWTNSPAGLQFTNRLNQNGITELLDVTTTTPADGQVLMWNVDKWENAANPAGVNTFLQLGDTPIDYNPHANKFVVVSSGESGLEFLAASLDSLTDVTFTGSPGPVVDQVLKYNGTDWENTTLTESDISDLGNYLPIDGTKTMGADLDMDINNILITTTPSLDTHAANKKYIDDKVALLLPLTGGTLTGILAVNPTGGDGSITLQAGDTGSQSSLLLNDSLGVTNLEILYTESSTESLIRSSQLLTIQSIGGNIELQGYVFASSVTLNMPTVDGTANQVMTTDGSGAITFETVDSANVTNTPAGNIASTDVQGAIDELDQQIATLDTNAAPINSPVFTGIPELPQYTIAGSPGLPTATAGGMIYVSDASAGAGAMCFGNGTDWIDVVTGVIVIA